MPQLEFQQAALVLLMWGFVREADCGMRQGLLVSGPGKRLFDLGDLFITKWRVGFLGSLYFSMCGDIHLVY